MTFVDGSIFKKIFQDYNVREKLQKKILIFFGYCNDEIILNTKTPSLNSACL